MGKCSLPILAALLILGTLPAHAEVLTLSEAAARVNRLQQPNDPLRPPEYVPEEHRQETTEGLKSPWGAMGLSLILPGAGHVYGGAKGRGKVFMGAEAVVWGIALGFNRWSAWRKADAVDYATEHAGISPDGKDDQFMEYLEFYDNRDEFNRAGRIIEPSRPFLPETQEYYWQWDSRDSRQIYRGIRNDADAASRNSTFMVYVAVLNRIVAAADAFRIVSRYNAQARKDSGFKFTVKPRVSFNNPSVMVHARYRF